MSPSPANDPAIPECSVAGSILVAGLTGVPGYNAFYFLRKLFPGQVVGIALPETLVQFKDIDSGLVGVDSENPEELDRLWTEFPIRTIVEASGWCALKPCELDPALGRRLNVDIGLNLMRAAKSHQARLIRLSTDLVFDGNPYERDGKTVFGDYLEDWPVSPVTVYGKLMVESESRILEEYPEAAILRIALPMGPSLNGHAGAIDWIESRFRKGRPATLYFDEVRSNLYVQDLNRVIALFLDNGASGIFHLGGPRPLSLYQIAQVINKLGNYPPELLMGCMRAAAGPMPPRAGNVSMNTNKLMALIGSDVVRPWPRQTDHVPAHLEWHQSQNETHSKNTVAMHLYGYGAPGAWEHPNQLIPE